MGRCISLGPTEGLSTWSCGVKFIFQPVVVPVGKLCLGRIFNVLGTSVDRFEDLPQSAPFRTESSFLLHMNRATATQNSSNQDYEEATLDFIESIRFESGLLDSGEFGSARVVTNQLGLSPVPEKQRVLR